MMVQPTSPNERSFQVHLFDVDNTVVRRTSAWYFIREALNEKLIDFSQVRRLPFDIIKYKLAIPNNDFIENTLRKLAGLDKDALERVAETCFQNRIKKNIYTGAFNLIRELIGKKLCVKFATSSLDFIIRPLERFFGIEQSLVSEVEFQNGRTTGSLVGKSFFGPKKKEITKIWLEKHGLSPCDVTFYSDSYTDIPLLEYCGNPVAVNPDLILAHQAKKRGWKILRFNEVLGDLPPEAHSKAVS